MIFRITKILLISLFCLGFSYAQVNITSYNLLNYPGTDTSIRNPYFRIVITSLNPDILVVQEITSQQGVNGFLNNVLNYEDTLWSAGTFIDGPDTDNGIFYKKSLFVFISNTPIQTALRDINEFKLVNIISQDTFRIYSVHLKASEGTSNEILRAAEVDSLRKVTNALPFNSNFIVCGDFNIYRSGEPAYIKLLEITPGYDGNLNDPLNLTGIWNNSLYAIYHTQSTRVRSFGGGSTGGLDDRFDMILYSNAINNPGGISYVPNSLTPYGNDGNHYNDSINRPPNDFVPQIVADALHYASDHLPVYSLFTFPPISSANTLTSNTPEEFILYQNYPNPFNPKTKIKFSIPENSFTTIKIFDILGKEIDILVNEKLQPGTYEINWDAALYPSGVYFYRIETDRYTDVKKMLLIK